MNILLMAGIIVAVDRATKEIALRRIGFGRSRHRFIRIVLTRRTLLDGGASPRALVALWIAAVACMVGALLCAPTFQHSTFVTAGIAAALAGASGNLVDRIIHGAVVDFVAVGRWPVFNVADAAIVAGATLGGASLIGW
jgi:signal peptidase II